MPLSELRKVVRAALAIAVVFGGGTVGFHALISGSWHAAFYRTAVTATLTGLDTTPPGEGAELLTIALALGGVAIFGYPAVQALESIAREVDGDARKDKRRQRMIDELDDHFIICGYGRVGRRAAEEFAASGQPFVVLDLSAEAIAVARERGVLFLEGQRCRGQRSRRAPGSTAPEGVLASADSDAENLYITLSARSRRPELTIVARASTREAERKIRARRRGPGRPALLRRPGPRWRSSPSSRRSPPSSSSSRRMRGRICASRRSRCGRECASAGRTIRELRIRSTTGRRRDRALRKPDGTFDMTPKPGRRDRRRRRR